MNLFFSELLQHPMFLKAAFATSIALIVLVLARQAQGAATQRIRDKDLRYRTRKLISMGGYLLVLIALLTIFSDQLTNLAVILGALSVGIGFALRELIQSLIGWGAIAFLGLYKPGDRIQMGGAMGDVIDITPLTTTLMECGNWVKSDQYTGRLIFLSNSLVFRESIINYSSEFPFLWDEIVIPVQTDSDHRLARELILEVGQQSLQGLSDASRGAWLEFARHYRVEDARLDPVVTLSFDAHWIEFTLRYVVDYRLRRSTKDRLYTQILESFERSDGRVRVATSTLQLTGLPPVQLTTSGTTAPLRDAPL